MRKNFPDHQMPFLPRGPGHTWGVNSLRLKYRGSYRNTAFTSGLTSQLHSTRTARSSIHRRWI